jgi:hypothetical protein
MSEMDKKKYLVFLLTIGFFININLNGQNLEKHRWENRVLIIKDFSEQSDKYQLQLKEFVNSSKELKERKLILYQIIGEEHQIINLDNKALANIDSSLKSDDNFENAPDDEFRIVLIGLDGGIKLEQAEILKKEKLFQIIDSMPMRARELRNKIREKEN